MTLFKQMALAVSLIIVTILGAVMVINYQSARHDMIESLYETTVNNISSLANKLSDSNGEKALIGTIIDSEFDSGYYKKIEYKSSDGSFVYKQEDNDPVAGVPPWFISFADIYIKPVTSDISSGWDMIGSVTVVGDNGIIYKALYKTFIKLLYLFVIFVTISLAVLGVMLHFILKPLKRMQYQAEAITRNEFVIEEKEPFTTEFKDVSTAMNSMVTKVEEIFNKANEAAKRNRELLYNDPVTKLFNRRYLMLKMPDLIKLENKTNGGSIVFIALSGAEVLNQVLGRRDADGLFLKFADVFNEATKEYPEKVIARTNGTEFTMMLPDCDKESALKVADSILEQIHILFDENSLDKTKVYIDIGVYQYDTTVTISELMTKADTALSVAKADPQKHISVYADDKVENAMGKEQWREIIEEAIAQDYFSLKFWSTLDTKTKEINHKVMTFTIDGGEDKRFFYGDFIAPAINLGLVGKMYIVALQNLLTNKHPEIDGATCSIRLSNEFLKDNNTFQELSDLFAKYAKTLNFKLYFEVTDTFATQNTALLKAYTELFKKYHYGFGLNSFMGESSDFTYLKILNPEFIKADISFLLDQSEDSMNALQVITESLGISIIATFVKTQEELEQLHKLKIVKVQGPITDKFK